MLGRKLGWRAALAGGLCGTLPDLDVFVPLGDPVSDFTYHRSASHSVFVLALATPVVAEIIVRSCSATRAHWREWYVLVFLALLTHPILDCFTIYGTQILWPLDKTPVAWGTVFIIDPAYTLPLLVGVLSALFIRRNPVLGHRLNVGGLALSTAYLGATILAKQQADLAAERAVDKAGLENAKVMSIAGPFTSLFWRIVAVDETSYYNAYYSVLDDEDDRLEFAAHSRNIDLLSGLENDWATQRLQWFSKGHYTLKQIDGDVILSDLRMGFEPNYVFTFKLGTISNPHTVALSKPERVSVSQDMSGLSWVWARLWSSDVPALP